MSIRKLLTVLPTILAALAVSMLCAMVAYADDKGPALVGGTAAEAEVESAVMSVSTSNYGTYENTSLWVNCGADFIGAAEGATAQFFLCENDGDEVYQALVKGTACPVGDIPPANEPMALRSEKLESGLLLPSGLEPGDYHIGCRLQSGDDAVYAYTSFTVYPTAAEYARAGLDKIIRSYQNSWFVLRGNYVGLGKETDDFGNDWEAWIFPALGSKYLLDGAEVDFDVAGSFLSSYDGLTYLDQLKKKLDSYDKRGVLEEQGTKQVFKWIAAVAACGKDPRDFEGYNLVELMMNYAYNEDGTPALDENGMLQIPAHLGISDDILFLSYELLGLEIAGAKPAEGYTDAVRKGGIKKILSVYGADKVADGTKIASDWYSMAMLPLMFLKTDAVYGDECVRALEIYEAIICGSYIGSNGAMTYSPASGDEDVWSLPNANTESVAINTLVAKGLAAESFESVELQKPYGTLLTALCGDVVDDGVLYGSVANRMATYQTLGALVDLYNGKSCFEIAHEKYRQNYPSYSTKEYGKLGVTSISSIADQAYNGKALTPSVTVVGTEYNSAKVSERTLVKDVDYTIEYKNNINPGKATVVVNGIGDYYGSKEVSFNILKQEMPTTVKKAQPMTVKPVLKKVSFKKLKKKALIVKGALVVKNNQGKVTYKKLKGSSSKLTINKNTGKIKVKKKTKKGTYRIKVKVTAAGNAQYNSGSKTVTVKVKVR